MLVSGKRFVFLRTQHSLAAQLRQIKQQLGHTKIKTVCCIVRSDYQILNVNKPKCEKKDRYNALLWQLSEEFNLATENIALSILPQQAFNLSVSDADDNILVAFALKDKMISLEETFQQVNIQIQKITLYELAICNYFYYQYPKNINNKLIIYRTKTSVQILLIITHYFHQKFDVDDSESTPTEHAIAMVVFRALSVFRALHQQNENLAIYCNALPEESDFISKLSQTIEHDVNQYSEDYDDLVSLPAAGMYLAMQDKIKRTEVNLCSTARLRSIKFSYRLVKKLLLIFILIILLGNVTIFICGKYLHQKTQLQKNEIKVVNQKLHQQLKDQSIALLPNYKLQTSAIMVKLFTALAKQYYPSLWLTQVETLYKNGRITIKLYGKAFNGNAVYQLLLSLSELNSFNNFNFNHIEVDGKPLNFKKNNTDTPDYFNVAQLSNSDFKGVYFLVATEKPINNKKNKRVAV